MSSLSIIPPIIIKNLKRMIYSKASVVILFFMPLVILLVVGGAYRSVGGVKNVDIGFVSADNSIVSDKLRDAFDQKYFHVLSIDSVDRCNELLKRGKVDVCIELKNSDAKAEVVFYVDYSKINLVHAMLPLLSDKIDKESEDMRLVFVEALSEKVSDSLRSIRDIKNDYNLAFAEFDRSSSSLESVRQSLDRSKSSIDSAKASLDKTERKSRDVYSRNSASVQSFGENLEDVNGKLSSQKSAVDSLLAYNHDCESNYIPDIFAPGFDPSSVSDEEKMVMLERYGKCKCVDYYRGNLGNISNDLALALGYVSNAQLELKNTELRNQEFYDVIKGSIKDYKVGLVSLETEKAEASDGLQEFNDKLSSRLGYFKNSLGNTESLFQNLSLEMNLSSGNLVQPILVSVRPISVEREVVVYLFPVLYLFVVMFVALLFSSTFAHSERVSYAAFRNAISPLGWFAHVVGLYLSLLFVVFIQAGIMLVCGGYFFGLSLDALQLFEIAVVAFFFLSLFVLLGIFIGYFLRSQLVVMLVDLSFSTFVFLYSNVIRPEEMMSGVVRYIVSVNPFVLASSSISKIILYRLSIDWSGVGFLVLESLVLVFCLYIFRGRFKSVS